MVPLEVGQGGETMEGVGHTFADTAPRTENTAAIIEFKGMNKRAQ